MDEKENELKKELAEIKALLCQILDKFSAENQQNQTQGGISIGNEGVQTDRQSSDEKTDLLNLVGGLRKELYDKFKSLTRQEARVFSFIYTLEEEGKVDYTLLASKLGLSESSVRDYIMKLKRKGIPIMKEKINNKKILLKIRPELRMLVSLDNLLKIRENRLTE